MDQMTLLYVMTAFVVISAIALCIQAGMLIGMYKTTKAMQTAIEPLVPKVEKLVESSKGAIDSAKTAVDSAKTTIDQSQKQIAEITGKASAILDSTKHQLSLVEGVVTDATSRAKVQLERVEMVLDDTVSRAHEAIATVHGGVMRPLTQMSGVATGVKTALAYLARGNRPSVAQVTTDEEMFI